ncbi:pyruvate kinase [Thioflavicoccus mobilis 8321]|uniref:Pyruvate kinase n=1 Tax=Thioflavicoccus mobilis 8321 TaxID=765912 RepID=L0H1X9_9GAMM|nr:pyruvate kinase [Thioflavicoccus mobilis]AGA91589.1 pyruvate kinase [Thioflavicoccus mobilis 8321]
MQFPRHKTKIVATIGPASDSPDTLREMMHAGLDIARLNFSHGDQDYHATLIARLREAAADTGRRVAIMGDLPGPKMRIGDLDEDPIELVRDETVTLTTEEGAGTARRFSVSFPDLPKAVQPGDRLFLNDGFILLKVVEVSTTEVKCNVRVGGELRSRKGLNLPGIDLGICAFTDNDRAWLAFAAEHRLDAVSQSFVASAEDIVAVRRAANALDYTPFIIAKIERAGALEHLDDILAASDGLMVARGDLGVEIPIEEIAVTQKRIMEKANRAGKPVITATQMLESMVTVRRPTRAEATDVANAILDGTDCVMLSAESAMGRYPVESIAMLAGIAAAVEPTRPLRPFRTLMGDLAESGGIPRAVDLIAESVHHMIARSVFNAVLVPTRSGDTARNVARSRLPVWIIALSPNESTCQALAFSYGVLPVAVDVDRADWADFARTWLATQGIRDGLVLLTQGPSAENPRGNHRLEILELGRRHAP